MYILLSLMLLSSIVNAQDYSYKLDTIKVDKTDTRNVYSYSENDRQSINNTTVDETDTQVQRVFNPNNLRFGANLGLSISHNYTFLNIGPQIGYEFNKYFLLGVGVRYYYSKTRAYTAEKEYLYNNNMLATNLFGYFHPVQYIALFVQPEINYLWSKEEDITNGGIYKDAGWIPSLVVGGGLRLGRTYITLNYDLAQQDRSPYPHGIFWNFSTFF